MTNDERRSAPVDRAMNDPASLYRSPREVLEDAGLSRAQKIEILRRWAYDVRELQVAEEENMPGAMPVELDEILDALHELGAGTDTEHAPPTKQGGI